MFKGVVWSLFDGSGLMVKKYAENGYLCFCFNADTANHGEYKIKVRHPNIVYVNEWITKSFDPVGRVVDGEDGKQFAIEKPNIIFAFPDCTFFAHSGAQHERSDEDIQIAYNNARLVESLGLLYNCPWMVENPVGKLSTLWRKPDFYFHPYEFGGYLAEDEGSFHPKMPLRNGYTKKTCIWCGNGFNEPERKPVEHIGFFWGWKFLGGKSEKTKQLRSLTPEGFARAVYEANK